jgi:F0F1-type ATP synthase membrane subunit b/b'
MDMDESFVLMISFVLFCLLAAKPIFYAISDILKNKVLEISKGINEAESLRESSFKDLKKSKRSFTAAKREYEDHLKVFVAGVDESYRKHYTELSVTLEKKYNNGLKFLQIQRDQKVLSLYENLLRESSDTAASYIEKNRSKLPDDLEIARALLHE